MSKSICLYHCREMARNNNAFRLGPMHEKEKLAANGGNYADWFRNLGFVLKVAKKDYVLKEALPAAPAEDASQDDKNVYETKVHDHTACNTLDFGTFFFRKLFGFISGFAIGFDFDHLVGLETGAYFLSMLKWISSKPPFYSNHIFLFPIKGIFL